MGGKPPPPSRRNGAVGCNTDSQRAHTGPGAAPVLAGWCWHGLVRGHSSDLWGCGSSRTCIGPRRFALSAHLLTHVHPPMWQLKQMQELEQEKEVLLQGLEMMARGRDWYQQQLQRVQERQRRLGQSRASAVSDATQG